MLNVGKYLSITCLLFVCSAILSCRDEYIYDDPDKVPEWLGESIYEELQNGKNFKGESFDYFLRVIDDCNYKDVLMATGSKTVFVANDEAFLKGIYDNWGLTSYEQLNPGHKRTILFNAMLDNAYLLEMLSSAPAAGEPISGECLRRETSADIMDTIYFYSGDQLPANNPHWDRFRESGLRMALDATEPMMVHFLNEQLKKNGVENSDMKYLFNGRASSIEEAFIYDKKVIKRDVTCKNGYIHQLDGLLIPPSNMAEEIRKDSTLSIYSRMLDRYAVPVYNEALTDQFNYRYNTNEKVYEKRYFTANSNRASFGSGYLTFKDFEGTPYETQKDSALKFSPGWNRYRSQSYKEDMDMAAMFVPTNEALEEYFAPGGLGYPLIERYGCIDSIALHQLRQLIDNMMEPTFNGSVPSKFATLKDDASDEKGVSPSHLVKSIIANNGVIYVTDRVYSPASFVSVSAPSQFNTDMSVMGKMIDLEGYQSYLLAMKSVFSVVNPANDAFLYYDPVTENEAKPRRYKIVQKGTDLEFVYNEYDSKAGQWDAKDNKVSDAGIMQNIRFEILEHNIVVGNIEDGNKYYQTKGGATIKVETKEGFNDKNEWDTIVTQIWGGRELEQMLAGNREGGIPVTRTFNQKNGNTYRIEEGLIHPATRSVYTVLKETEEFKSFFDLCDPEVLNTIADETASVQQDGYTPSKEKEAETAPYRVFVNAGTNASPMYNVASFTPYQYTIYVPNEAAIARAIADGLPTLDDLLPIAETITENREQIKTWAEEIGVAQDDNDQKAVDSLTNKKTLCIEQNEELRAELKESLSLLVGFVKYHMHDNSVFVDNNPDMSLVRDLRTTAWDDETSKFDKLALDFADNTIVVKGLKSNMKIDDPLVTCKVVTDGAENIHYNVIARDIQKDGKKLAASSNVVLHLIDGYLINERLQSKMKP